MGADREGWPCLCGGRGAGTPCSFQSILLRIQKIKSILRKGKEGERRVPEQPGKAARVLVLPSGPWQALEGCGWEEGHTDVRFNTVLMEPRR